MRRILLAFVAAVLVLGLCFTGTALGADLRIALTQDAAGDAKKYQPLLEYLMKKGLKAQFVAAKDYNAAAEMFSRGEVDALFAGSGIAGTMIIKELAVPVARPVGEDQTSTYWAVVLAPKGSQKFTGSAEYFKGKKVAFAKLASSGEIYFRSLEGSGKAGATIQTVPNHGSAIEAVSKGLADIAIVKNRVWDKSASNYANVEKVGEDKGENPDGTLMVSKKMDAATVSSLSSALLAVGTDTSAEAQAVKSGMKVKGFLKTTEKDFEHTLTLLKKAGVTKSFNFAF